MEGKAAQGLPGKGLQNLPGKTAKVTVKKKKRPKKKEGEVGGGDKAGVARRLLHGQDMFSANLRSYTSPFESKVTHPFVTGSARTHNIAVKIQLLEKNRKRLDPASAPIQPRKTKPLFAPVKNNNKLSKGCVEIPESQEWSNKVRDVLVALHKEYAALVERRAELRRAKDADSDPRLVDVQRRLTQVELHMTVAVKLYEQNQKLREEVEWLRKNIRPGRRKGRKGKSCPPALPDSK